MWLFRLFCPGRPAQEKEKPGKQKHSLEDTGNGDPFDESAVNEVFTTLRDQLIYLVDAGSTVVDKMGHGTVTGKDGTEYTYYFDFVKVDSLTVGGETIFTSESTESKDTYTFGDHSTLTVKRATEHLPLTALSGN